MIHPIPPNLLLSTPVGSGCTALSCIGTPGQCVCPSHLVPAVHCSQGSGTALAGSGNPGCVPRGASTGLARDSRECESRIAPMSQECLSGQLYQASTGRTYNGHCNSNMLSHNAESHNLYVCMYVYIGWDSLVLGLQKCHIEGRYCLVPWRNTSCC